MAETEQRNANGTFKPGHRKLSVRTVGVPNKITADIKAGMIHSAVAHGRDGHGDGGLPGFCEWLLRNDLKSWCGIFGRLVPLQVHGDIEVGGGTVTVNIQSVPVGHYLTAEQAECVMKPQLVIDNDTEPNNP